MLKSLRSAHAPCAQARHSISAQTQQKRRPPCLRHAPRARSGTAALALVVGQLGPFALVDLARVGHLPRLKLPRRIPVLGVVADAVAPAPVQRSLTPHSPHLSAPRAPDGGRERAG
eukprot:3214998-Rhodomonas_salina.2